jgi:hypothetical protein
VIRRRIAFSLLAALALHFTPSAAAEQGDYKWQVGDVVFQSTKGEQAEAIRKATGSRFTHCGVVFEQAGEWKVLEASQPVKVTPLEDFRKRSLPGTFQVRRLKDSLTLTAEALELGRAWGQKQVGLNYDPHFRWDDETLYCSELVWKIYKKAGVELCATRHFKDYALESAEVQAVIKERYGSVDKMPQDEPVVSPGDLADSPLLVEVPQTKG